jgi:hypothetical protein
VKQLLPTPPKGDKLEARLTTATIQPGAVGNWHTYPNHPVVCVAEGTVTVEFRDGEPKVFGAGEAFRRAGQPGTQGEEQRAHTRQAGDFSVESA